MNKRIFLSPPHMSGSEMKYIKEAFEQNWIAPLGPNVDAFEESLANYCHSNYAAALSSGTAAIHIALILLGVSHGDEVIASSFTFSATINPIVYQGAIPILVDSEKETWNMDPVLLEEAIKNRIMKGKKPKAIIPVHLYGMPAKINEINAIALKYDIPVIEDAAEALGSRFKEKPVGSFGKMAVLSFNGNKIITTSGGGALISNEKKLIERTRFLATQARDKAAHYQHSNIGFNYRMSNVLAGIGRGQLEFIEEKVKARRDNFLFYKKHLQHIRGLTFLEEPGKDFYSNRWLTTILINPDETGITREILQEKLEMENIETRPLWKPMHLQPVFSGCPAYLNGVSEKLFNNGLCLPSGSGLSKREKQIIINAILKCIHPVC
ncbi:MAG: aminotransferase class I/II-fold pyridoxal phosphate-dependent enzyme [Bacteroidales bacterium]|nr:aminotransferase class I/II-fold pyridoxal phosphate-dependent enzyme [Bacteroidales bacterium]